MSGKSNLRLVAWMVAIALVAVPVVGVLEGWFAANRWPVRQLEVHATFQHVSARAVEAAVRPALGAGFFAIDLGQVRREVAAVPWVARVEVGKHWPDALDVTITEIQPVARVGSDGLLDRSGRIFKVPDAAAVRGLPQFQAPPDRVADVARFYQMAQASFTTYALQVAEVDLSARGSWTLVLANGGRVVVGDQHPEQRLARFARALPVLLRGRTSGFDYADLRYSNGFAVRWPVVPAAVASPKPTSGVISHVADGNV